jgi:polyphosphate glucokinase
LARETAELRVLVIDVGGTSVKVLLSGENTPRKFPSGPTMTPGKMASGVKKIAADWKYDAVTIGYPGVVMRDRPVAEPHNLPPGWVAFDYRNAFRRPFKMINDAAMQALGSYRGGKMLFLGLGTGLGTAFVVDGIVEPMELSHLPYRKATYEDYVGSTALLRMGRKKWRKHVRKVIELLSAALEPDDVVIGGGNVEKMGELPTGCRPGDNMNAFLGGFRLWAKPQHRKTPTKAPKAPRARQGKTPQ